ncbi:MAG TPA: helix-turn-helix domain-containing protein [Gemmatimonadaceae bacterium]|nr:helix-turn-helix domain-containing protein [Gemmatimonadaceae bacterium]
MPRDGTETRIQIMDAAQDLILRQGFAATTVDAVLERTGLTKGAFFHHFKSKNELANAVIQRFADHDRALLDNLLDRAERLSSDPMQQVLILVGLMEEMADQLTDPNHGCLFASYVYEAQLFDTEVHRIIRDAFHLWRDRLGQKLRDAVAHRPPRVEVDIDELADMLSVIVEGAYVLGKSLGDSSMLARQLRHYRSYLELVFGLDARVPAAR